MEEEATLAAAVADPVSAELDVDVDVDDNDDVDVDVDLDSKLQKNYDKGAEFFCANDCPKVTPISNINLDGLVTIKARITNKSNIRDWENENGSGTRFFFEVLDKTGEIRCISFNQEAEEMFQMTELNRVYTITNMHAKRVQNQENKDKYRLAIKHDFELHVTAFSVIDGCECDEIPFRTYEFKTIHQLRGMVEHNEVKVVDVIAVCREVGELRRAHWCQGENIRDLYLVDASTGPDSAEGIALTLWGQQACEFEQPDKMPFVVVVKRARLSSYKGGILNSGDTNMMINPDLPETNTLLKWYATK